MLPHLDVPYTHGGTLLQHNTRVGYVPKYLSLEVVETFQCWLSAGSAFIRSPERTQPGLNLPDL
jgi:hypothetical protein